MIYQAYQLLADLMAPLQAATDAASCTASPMPASGPHFAREWCALLEWSALVRLRHERPPFGIHAAWIDGGSVAVSEEVALATPFCSLLHFRRDIAPGQPRVLLIAPLAGHFASLLRATAATMLADHDVYLTDWRNARDIPLCCGPFGFDDFVAQLIGLLRFLGPGTHVVAVCQPTVATLAAVALMAEDGDPALPRSMTLMAGPIDARVNPTRINELAVRTPLAWFEANLIDTVPARFAGARRRVYPGFVQVCAFLSMNLDRHIASLIHAYQYKLDGETAKAEAIRAFYTDYFATMDLPAEFYLETVSRVFQQHVLPRACLTVAGRRVDLRAIRRTALLTIEGENDDICAVGQTEAAQELCSKLRPNLKSHYVQTGVGHYGVFAGRRWATQVYPLLRKVIHETEQRCVEAAQPVLDYGNARGRPPRPT
ncbi:polyhydroxyalkanoate depolymerase [Cupriavidus basilensis]|uniref:polyhydroxyalkanoate depolymerase n=1 Tax=Cupriavidus basilensis TaxID=68895 RepID=UPI0023E89D48|nr:polyhydroxyalkanoate depolymerase [Cupriavidus basilensis]MDF3883159.1 polyhydroxyalkanoate depolymerase [Cupriavidus basilensis]